MCLGMLGYCNVPPPRIRKMTQRFVHCTCSHPRWKDRETQTKSQSLDLAQFQKHYEKREPGNLLIIRILHNWTRHNRHPAVLIAFGFHQFQCVSVRLENLTVNQLAKKLTNFYQVRRFNTAFTKYVTEYRLLEFITRITFGGKYRNPSYVWGIPSKGSF